MPSAHLPSPYSILALKYNFYVYFMLATLRAYVGEGRGGGIKILCINPFQNDIPVLRTLVLELIQTFSISCFVQLIICELRCRALPLGGNNCFHKLRGMNLKFGLASRCLLLMCSVMAKPHDYSSALPAGPPIV